MTSASAVGIRRTTRAYRATRTVSRPTIVCVLVGALLLLLLAVTSGHGEWVSDSWIHAGTVAEVARHPLHPVEPLTGEHVPFAYFSPWAMALGWLMRLTGASVWVVLTVAGLLATAWLVWSWCRLIRALTPAAWAPPLALLLMLLLWGTGTWYWSGFPALGSLSVGFVWPSVFAAACWCAIWRTALRLGEVGRAHRLAAFLLLPGLLLLVHPFTAAVAAISVLATFAGRARHAPAAVAEAIGAAVVSGGLALAWPWTGLSSTFGDPAAFDAIHDALYQELLVKYGLLPLVVPALLVRLVRRRGDPVFATAAICAGAVAIGALTGSFSLGRLGPGVALPGQAALAILLAEGPSRRRTVATRRVAARPASPPGRRRAGTCPAGRRRAGPWPPPRRRNASLPPPRRRNAWLPPPRRRNASLPPPQRRNAWLPPNRRRNAWLPPRWPRTGSWRPDWRRTGFAALAVATGAAVAVGGYANAWALARSLPDGERRAAEAATGARSPYPRLGWLARHVRAGDTAVANSWYARRELPAYGLRSVRTQWPSPGVGDEMRRMTDEDRILGRRPATAAQRSALLRHYRVRWILWRPGTSASTWPFAGARLVACGPHGIALLRVDPQARMRPPRCP